MEKVLTIRPAGFADVRGLLARAAQRGDHTGGTLSIEDACAGAVTWAVEDGAGRVVMAYAMRQAGGVCWIIAAGGDAPGVDLVRSVLPVMERQAKALGCGQLAVTTQRGGLVRKLKKNGFEQTAVTLRKALA